MDKAISKSEAKSDARFDAIDKATRLLHEDSVRVPNAIDRSVAQVTDIFTATIKRVEEVTDEKFRRVDAAFIERDKRSEQLAVGQKDAADKLALAGATNIAAALLAQKETADKSEKNMLESMKGLRDIFQTSMGSLTIQINDVKSRLDKGEGRSSATDPAMTDLVREVRSLRVSDSKSEGSQKSNERAWGYIAAAVGMIFGLIGAIGGTIMVIVAIGRH